MAHPSRPGGSTSPPQSGATATPSQVSQPACADRRSLRSTFRRTAVHAPNEVYITSAVPGTRQQAHENEGPDQVVRAFGGSPGSAKPQPRVRAPSPYRSGPPKGIDGPST